MELKTFIETVLSRHGCLVEDADSRGLQVLFPQRLQEILAVSEMETLSLPAGGVKAPSLVHRGRDFIETLEPLVMPSGLFSSASFPQMRYDVRDPESLLAAHLTIQNGIFRLTGTEKRTCSYLIVHYRMIATADTRVERLATTIINEQTQTVPEGLAGHIEPLLDRAQKGDLEQPAADLSLSLQRTGQQASASCRRIFQDFIRNLDKRLERDLKRLQEYYQALAGEIEKRLRKKGDDPEEQRRALSQLDATKTDYFKKIQDAKEKYALEITIEPVCALRIVLIVDILEVAIQRRKNSRRVELPLNPVTRRLESLLCTRCHEAVLNFSLSDDLQILCPACFSTRPAITAS